MATRGSALPAGPEPSGTVDAAVLAELRGMRADIQHLTEKIASAATRDELGAYVTREAFNAHVASHSTGLDARRWWATYGLSVAALVLAPLIWLALSHISLALH